MNNHKYVNQSEIHIFQYNGLIVYFLSTDSTPIMVYAKRDTNIGKILITLKNGILQAHEYFENVNSPLGEKDKQRFLTIVDEYISEIMDFWQDTYIYGKTIKVTVIKKLLE